MHKQILRRTTVVALVTLELWILISLSLLLNIGIDGVIATPSILGGLRAPTSNDISGIVVTDTLQADTINSVGADTRLAPTANFASSYKTGPQSASTNDTITYTIVIANTGAPTTGVILSDTLPYTAVYIPGSCTFRRATGVPQTCGLLSQMWQEDFATGDRITTTFSVLVTAGSMNWPMVNCAFLGWNGNQMSMCFSTVINKRTSVYLPLLVRNYTPMAPSLTLVANPLTLAVGDTSTLVATVLDGYGAPVTGIAVTFSTPDPLGSGALTPLGTTTDVSGQITATLSSSLVGVVRVTATASNGAAAFVDVQFVSGLCAPYLITQVNAGAYANGVAIDTAGRRVFIAQDSGIAVIHADTYALITWIPLSSAFGVAYDPDHNRIWVTRINADLVTVLDGTTYAQVINLPAGGGPRNIAYNPTNERIYVATNYGTDGTVNVYNAASPGYMRTLTDVNDPVQIAVNPITNKIYVTNHANNTHITVIDGNTHLTHRMATQLLDAFGVTVDTTRNLIYATSIDEGRLFIIDGATEQGLGKMDIRRSDGRKVPLRAILVNSSMGAEGHLLLITSSEDGEEDQLLLIPNGWPTLGTPVPLDIASYPLEGIALDPVTNRVWVPSVTSALASVVQDGEPVCSVPFSFSAEDSERKNEFSIEVTVTP